MTEPEKQNAFFKAVYTFLENRYGKKNVIQAWVHYDEGKREKVINEKTGGYVYESDGSIKTRLVVGQPHLHFCWIPVVKIDHSKTNRKGSKSGKIFSYHERMSNFSEKICAKEVLTKTELKKFHTDLDKYLKANGIEGEVINGATKGRGYTVEQLKERYEMQERIQELERELEVERAY